MWLGEHRVGREVLERAQVLLHRVRILQGRTVVVRVMLLVAQRQILRFQLRFRQISLVRVHVQVLIIPARDRWGVEFRCRGNGHARWVARNHSSGGRRLNSSVAWGLRRTGRAEIGFGRHCCQQARTDRFGDQQWLLWLIRGTRSAPPLASSVLAQQRSIREDHRGQRGNGCRLLGCVVCAADGGYCGRYRWIGWQYFTRVICNRTEWVGIERKRWLIARSISAWNNLCQHWIIIIIEKGRKWTSWYSWGMERLLSTPSDKEWWMMDVFTNGHLCPFLVF